MARMIPPVPYQDTDSDAELSVFKRLRDEPGTEDWIVLHSVNLAGHRRAAGGEADFVVIVPGEGVVVIEVKGWRSFRLEDGIWYHGREQKPDKRGPFRQASEAMWSVREFLTRNRPDLARSMYWSACVFPFCDVPVQSPEWHAWQIVDRRTYEAKTLGQHVRDVLQHAKAHAESRGVTWAREAAGLPTTSQAASMASLLRPRYEVFEARGAEDRKTDAELMSFTRQQYRILDSLQANPRVLAQGPAGAGKTVLAMESVRRLAAPRPGGARTSRVMFACYNAQLAGWVRRQLASLGSPVVVDTLHRHMLRSAGAAAPQGEVAASFWTTELPGNALRALKARTDEAELFDSLVLDEAQDCMEPAYLDYLDQALKGGLENGRWHAFGDFEKQAIYERTPGTVELGLSHLGELGVAVRLRTNCRNTPRIAELVSILAGLEPDYDEILRPDDGREATWDFYANQADGKARLAQQIEALLADGVSERDIVVLSPRRDEEALVSGVRLDGRRLMSLRSGDAQGIRFGTVHGFKGLEARAVILTDVDTLIGPRAQDLFYVGVTRAQSRLVILAESRVQKELGQVLMQMADRRRAR